MAVFQVLVKNLKGRTQCLRFPSPEISCDELKAELAGKEGVPGDLMRLVTGTRELVSGSVLVADSVGRAFPSCTLLLRLPGGKGGFGSLLRGAATKAGQKKTSNFDACRDMSGRRLRHVNAEKKLKDWKAEARERELEKVAEEFLKKQKKKEAEDEVMGKDLDKFREDSLKIREEVQSAVMDSLRSGKARLKRTKSGSVQIEVKRRRILSLPHPLSEDEEDSDMEDATVPSSSPEDEAGPSNRSSEEASSSQRDDNGSSSGKRYEILRESSDEEASAPRSDSSNPAAEPATGTTEDVDISRSRGKEVSDSSGVLHEVPGGTAGVADEQRVVSNGHGDMPANGNTAVEPKLSPPVDVANAADGMVPIDLDSYATAKDLEVVGMESLKTELQNKGLKCGGSLSERAARLFLLKDTPLEKLDKSHFPKASMKGSRR